MVRRCSRPGCTQSALATLTYVYADSTAVLGPLATYAEPHSYDLCAAHAARLTVPRGWEAVRLAVPDAAPPPSSDDLEALADAVREAARSVPATAAQPRAVPDPPPGAEGRPAVRAGARPAGLGGAGRSRLRAPADPARRNHLRVLSNEP